MDHKNIFNTKEINIFDILRIIWQSKTFFIFNTSLFAIIGIIFALSLPNIYKSSTLLAPTENSFVSSNNAFKNVASFAGINIPNNTGNKSLEAVATIRSMKFFKENFLPNIHKPDLVAIKKWDSKSNNIVYDSEIYDASIEKWILKDSELNLSPSDLYMYSIYKSILSIVQDENGFYILSIEHQSPIIAKKWVELITFQINELFRSIDKKTSSLSVDYLNLKILDTSYNEVKQVLYNLMKAELQKLAVIESNESYIFRVIDPPYVPEKKFLPKRSTIVVIFTFIGGLISIIFTLIKYFRNSEKI